MDNLYDDDVVAWARQQAGLIRARQWSQLDMDNIVEEIEDVGKSEKRELQSRLCVLISHLLKWSHQPARRGRSWRKTIREQRSAIELDLQKHPSLQALLADPECLQDAWIDALLKVIGEQNFFDLPDTSPWTLSQALDQDFYSCDRGD
ncbi:DUF29 domain-containing protein [Duganella sp. BuS-21]|uniref:DUF29 domain-containing protein n=1 Tax=Duganella sp. BuS-21 TaxID=2943848 RepID=UPI0035A66D5C